MATKAYDYSFGLSTERGRQIHDDLEKLQNTIVGSPIDAKIMSISSNTWGRTVFVSFDKELDAGELAILNQIMHGSPTTARAKPKQPSPEPYLSPFTGKKV
jgi:hypothetical protein